MKRLIFFFMCCSFLRLGAQHIAQAEYFIDTDPGAGNGTAMLAYDGNFNHAFETAAANTVASWTLGAHVIGIRVRDNSGNWGPVFKTVVYVQTPYVLPAINVAVAEFFWDTDPGQGNGITMLAFDGNFNDAFEVVRINSTAAPSLGLHVLNIRIRDAGGRWGPVFRTIVAVQVPYVMPVIHVASAECFWNTDPGQGNGTAMVAFDGNYNNALESVLQSGYNTPGLGTHKLAVRVRDASNRWGPVFSTVVTVQNPYQFPSIQISAAELFWDTDPGQGNATPMLAFDGNYNAAYEAAVKAEQAFYLAQGLHVLHVRALNVDGIWSPVFRTVVYLDSCISTPSVNVTTSGPTTFCQGGSVTLTATAGFSSYYWRRNGNPIGGNTASLLVTQAGNYVVTVLDNNGCPASSQIITVVVNNPQATINPGPVVNFCNGDSVQLSTTISYSTYNWSNGATTQSIWVSAASTFNVIVTDAAGCVDTSDVVTVGVLPLPSTPVITQNSDTLFSSSTTGNQWYFNNVLIPGATGNYYVAVQTGNYTVVVTDSNGCSASSTPYAYVFTELGDPVGGALFAVVFPNPMSDDATLWIHAENYAGTVRIVIWDGTGKQVQDMQVASTGDDIRVELQRLSLSVGLYLYSVQLTDNTRLTGRFIKQ